MCAGAIYVATHKTEISEMDGLGRRMPFTYAAFLVGSLSIIGLPPFIGMWSKWYLGMGAVEGHLTAVEIVYIVSSLLNVAYLLPIVARGFFLPASNPATGPVARPGGPAAAPLAGGTRAAPVLRVRSAESRGGPEVVRTCRVLW